MDISRRGFTLIELLMVVTILGIMMTFTLPLLRVSPQRRVQTAARQLSADLDLVRTRAMATKRAVRMAIDTTAGSWVGFIDDDGDGIFAESTTETAALRGFGTREIDGQVTFGRGSASAAPGDTGSGPVTFANARVNFSGRGVTTPFGTRGTIYFQHRSDPNVVAAVSVSGSASFKVWIWRGSQWE